jgi:hypothetical protein
VFAKKSRRGWSSPRGAHGGQRRHGARARRGGGRFYSRAQGGEGVFLARQGNQVMAWAVAWPEYGARAGGDVRRVLRRAVNWAARRGTAPLRPMDARLVAPRKRAGMAVPRRMDRRGEACLGVRSSEVAARWRATPVRRCALWTSGLKPFRLTPFDRVSLQLFPLKWTK